MDSYVAIPSTNRDSSANLFQSVGAIVSTVQNPNTFDTFRDSSLNFQQFLPFFQTTAEGDFCVNVNLTAAGIEGVKDGANVTIQLIFNGGDETLYQVRVSLLEHTYHIHSPLLSQCADLTLSDKATIPDSVSCKNATSNAVATPATGVVSAPTATSPSGTGTAAASPSSTGNAAFRNTAIGASGLAGLLGVVAAFL